MPRLPVVSGLKVRRALERLGWQYKHHTGSHIIMDKSGQEYTISIPDHKELRPGLLRRIISMSGVSVAGFKSALDGK